MQQFLQPGVFPQRAEAPGFAERTAHAFVIAFGEETGFCIIEGGRFRVNERDQPAGGCIAVMCIDLVFGKLFLRERLP